MDSYDQCSECGANLPVDELVAVGADDDGDNMLTIYLCQMCCQRANAFESSKESE